jgi:hypothetical protein
LTGFDSAADEQTSSFGYHHDNKQPHIHNTKLNTKNDNENISIVSNQGNSMDRNQGFRHPILSSPKPLQIRKQSGQIHESRSQPQLNDNNPYRNQSNTPIYPPRNSSIRESGDIGASEAIRYRNRNRVESEAPSFTTTSVRSFSSYNENHRADNSFDSMLYASTAPSTVSSNRIRYLSDASTGIMGDFVPIPSIDANMNVPPPVRDRNKFSFDM